MNEPLDGVKSLKELREGRGYSQEGLAAKVGLTRVAYLRYESGQAEPKLSNFLSIARELGVSLKSLADSMGYNTSGIPDDPPSE